MKRDGEEDLIRDVLCPPGLEKASLERTLRAARRKRRFRGGMRAVAALAVLAASLLLLPKNPPVRVESGKEKAAAALPGEPAGAGPAEWKPEMVPGTSIRLISDEELLALFPRRPVALIGPDRERQLVFLDEVP